MLEALGNLGDFLGGIAVVVTLLYLAYQVRQNTKILRATSQQELAAVGNRGMEILSRNGVGRAYSVGLRRYPDMPDEERRQFVYAFTQYMNSIQEILALYEGGSLEFSTYKVHLSGFAAQVVTPGGAALWKEVRELFPEPFVAAVEERIAAGDLPDILASPYFTMDEPRAPVTQQDSDPDVE